MPQHPGIVATLVGLHLSVVAAVEAGEVVRVGAEVVLIGCVFCMEAVDGLAGSSASKQTPKLSQTMPAPPVLVGVALNELLAVSSRFMIAEEP